jgi:hypothetical protein
MVQTPTPPPLNADVAVVATVTLNASAITLSPGGMPVTGIAAIATTAATVNLSAITTSPSSTTVAAICLNICGMNPNITFAHLVVGNGQQNSGNSAGLQPTTQSNSGFSAGSAGGFGATHLGSTSTTTGTSGSNYVPRKKGNPLMLSPYSGSIHP